MASGHSSGRSYASARAQRVQKRLCLLCRPTLSRRADRSLSRRTDRTPEVRLFTTSPNALTVWQRSPCKGMAGGQIHLSMGMTQGIQLSIANRSTRVYMCPSSAGERAIASAFSNLLTRDQVPAGTTTGRPRRPYELCRTHVGYDGFRS